MLRFVRDLTDGTIARQLIWRCLTSKRLGFKHEDEIRCVILNQHKNFTGLVETFVDADGKKREYVVTKLDRKPGTITEIMVGPAAPSTAERDVADLLERNGYDVSGIPIMRSQQRL